MWQSLALVAVLTGVPSLARADGDVALHGAFWWIRTLELVIPDVRFERSFTADEDRFVLSLPLVIRAGHVNLGSSASLAFNHFAELQYQVTHNEWRGVVGERVLLGKHVPDAWTYVDAWMPFLEAGALLGSDGSGGVIGAGLGYGDVHAGLSFGVVVRFVVTNEERRGDIALDLQFPFNAL